MLRAAVVAEVVACGQCGQPEILEQIGSAEERGARHRMLTLRGLAAINLEVDVTDEALKRGLAGIIITGARTAKDEKPE